MTLQRDAAAELFGLAATFPRPGWVVLDAARDHRFTGELIFDTTPQVRVYVDRGNIYLAERLTDPSLGARLVDAGALSAVQLDRGTVRIGRIEHLGRLFERVPNIDRHTVLVTAELMTDECVGWLANQMVPNVTSTPYRHHESGMHQWNRAPGWVDLAPGDPLPAPDTGDEPVSVEPPDAPLPTRNDRSGETASDRLGLPGAAPAGADDGYVDELIQWNEPSWLDPVDARRRADSPATPAAAPVTVPAPDSQPEPEPDDDVLPELPSRDVSGRDRRMAAAAGRAVEPSAPVAEPPAHQPADQPADEATGHHTDQDDWIDRLASDGLPDPDRDLLGTPAALPRLAVEPLERFEIVWPSGEIDEDFGSVTSVAGAGHDPDHDRVGVTARLSRAPAAARVDLVEPEPDQLPEPDVDTGHDATDEAIDHAIDDATDDPNLSDEVVLAVRRAVASIEVGSLAARQRLVDATDLSDGSRGTVAPTLDPAVDPEAVPAPGRIAVRSGRNDWSRRTVTRSVFDEPAAEPEPEPAVVDTEVDDDDDRRAGALRRLITALRR